MISAGTVIKARYSAGLTQVKAAKLVHVSAAAWASWEQARFPMPRGLFELFLLKTRQVQLPPTQSDERAA